MFDGFISGEGIKRINSNKSIEFQNHVAKLNQFYDLSVLIYIKIYYTLFNTLAWDMILKV